MSTEELKSLLAAAQNAQSHARPSCSGFKVGAALLARDGDIFTGCNIESPSLTQNICAERLALMKALSEGASEFVAIAVVSDSGGYCFPCGACRQMLHEYAPELMVYLKSDDGTKEFSLKSLLPNPFNTPK